MSPSFEYTFPIASTCTRGIPSIRDVWLTVLPALWMDDASRECAWGMLDAKTRCTRRKDIHSACFSMSYNVCCGCWSDWHACVPHAGQKLCARLAYFVEVSIAMFVLLCSDYIDGLYIWFVSCQARPLIIFCSMFATTSRKHSHFFTKPTHLFTPLSNITPN